MVFLILMKGHPGSGKSSLARSICKTMGIPLLDKDDVRDCYQPIIHKGSDIDWNDLSYQVVRRQISLGVSVVVDTPLARVSLYQELESEAKQFDADLILVECVCSDTEEWATRIGVRGALSVGTNQSHKPRSWEQMQALLARYAGCWRWSIDGSTSIKQHFIVDTAGDQITTEERLLGRLAVLMQASSTSCDELENNGPEVICAKGIDQAGVIAAI